MIVTKTLQVEQEVEDDVICDICHKSCKPDKEDQFYSAEYMELYANWGYNTQSDMERWTAHVCYSCVREHLEKLVEFEITT